MSDLHRAMTRDVFALKKDIDDALYRFAERIQSEKPTMETLDLLVDECSRGIVLPAASYVKKTLRRHGVVMTLPDPEV